MSGGVGLRLPAVAALALFALAAAAGAAAQDGGSCTAPLKTNDATKPYCYVPGTISSESQQFLSKSAVKGASDVSTASAAQALRERFGAGKGQIWKTSDSGSYFSSVSNGTLGGVPVVTATPQGFNPGGAGKDRVLVYLHGGAYVVGSCSLMWAMPGTVAKLLGVREACIDYRLAPEHPFPAGLDDVVSAYRELLKTYPAKNIALLGDSAGGGLTLALLLRLKREGLPQPAAAALYSPWSELTKSGDTQTTLTGVDPVLQYELSLQGPALAYVGGDSSKLTDPLVSPLRADFSVGSVGQLPPILIQVGLRDTFLSDCVRLYRKLRDAGQPVELSPWEGMWHVFEAYDVPEARSANEEAAAFLRRHLGL
ncbi:alpha beta hydrolase [Raphidocelis subcapitata]|uniref:Alpha beta hydrolase n=1 Tax=Raphidocelis subcapitata TaxID=307507 RepID=A0A2V0P910_9CHLO|nr:alpha beta hydrolase [Raphidocelis subcapitata]|eukprot:GBF94350.1 alpha beta hydrolase [Raphidocelis subcapitata]